LKSVVKSLPVAHDGTHFQRIWAQRQRDLQGHDLSRLQIACQGAANSILPQLGRPSPATLKLSPLKHLHLHADVEQKPRIAPRVAWTFARCRRLSWITRFVG